MLASIKWDYVHVRPSIDSTKRSRLERKGNLGNLFHHILVGKRDFHQIQMCFAIITVTHETFQPTIMNTNPNHLGTLNSTSVFARMEANTN